MLPATLAAVLKELRNYSSTEWELFTEEWLRALQKKYIEVKRLGASGDLGRDVVAFTDALKLEGVWDNYQCKHLDEPLSASAAGGEIAKLIYFCFLKKFRPPGKMYFVAPRDVGMQLGDLLNSPSQLKAYVQQHWNTGYAKNIVKGGAATLEGPLASYVAAFDFSIFSSIRHPKWSRITVKPLTGQRGLGVFSRNLHRPPYPRKSNPTRAFILRSF
jgi:hypothetical protein